MEAVTLARGTHTAKLAVLVLLLLLSGLATTRGAQAHEGESNPMFEDAPILLAPYASHPTVTVDGRIGAGEYSPYGMWTDPGSGVSVDLVHDNDSLFLALSTPVPGWVAVGFSTDLDMGMGFLAVGQRNGSLTAVELVSANVSDALAFSGPSPSGTSAIQTFNITQQGNETTAEFEVAMNSTIWAFEPGEIVPTILAFSGATVAMPTSASASEVHPLRMYALRPQDDPAAIQKLFMADISPVPGLVAVAVVSVGVTAVFLTFVRRRGSR